VVVVMVCPFCGAAGLTTVRQDRGADPTW